MAAINRGEGLPDAGARRRRPGARDQGRARRHHPELPALPAGRRCRSRSRIRPASRYVEGEPDGLELAANGTGGHVARLRIRLDLFELLEHQRHGYLPSVAELQGRYLDLVIFKNELSAAPYQEVILTTGGTDAHRIRREPDGRLVMTSLPARPRGTTTMALDRNDKDFRHEGISYLDYKQVEMDRVLTGFLRPAVVGRQSSVIPRDPRSELTEDFIVRDMTEHPEMFQGFDPAVTHRWVETHLLDMVSRGKPTQAVAGLRPLHGFTYRFRNARRSRAYNADEQIYEMLGHASTTRDGWRSRDLKNFFFAGVDAPTEAPRLGDDIDVETQALISLSETVQIEITDRRVTDRDRRSYPPLYQEAADLLADDVLRLLSHRDLIPRTVLVEYLKILLRLPPRAVSPEDHEAAARYGPRREEPCRRRRVLPRRHRPAGQRGLRGSPSGARPRWYGRIPGFVRATFTVKKLDDFAEHLVKRGQLLGRLAASSR